jgi:hypothetical protein
MHFFPKEISMFRGKSTSALLALTQSLPKFLFILLLFAGQFGGPASAASLPAVEAKNGMVVTSQHLASKSGSATNSPVMGSNE